jgi:hypothetical protein
LVSCSKKQKFSFASGVPIQLNKQVKDNVWIFLMHDIAGIGSAPRIDVIGTPSAPENQQYTCPYCGAKLRWVKQLPKSPRAPP